MGNLDLSGNFTPQLPRTISFSSRNSHIPLTTFQNHEFAFSDFMIGLHKPQRNRSTSIQLQPHFSTRLVHETSPGQVDLSSVDNNVSKNVNMDHRTFQAASTYRTRT